MCVSRTDFQSPRLELPIQGDGSETRAFCFIDDAAAGFRIAGLEGSNGGIYHLGQNEETSIRDLILMMGDTLGVQLELVPGPVRPGGTLRRCPDINKLRGLGYVPGTSLAEGIRRTVHWYADHYMAQGPPEMNQNMDEDWAELFPDDVRASLTGGPFS